MRYKFFKCSDPFVEKNAERIIEVAQLAFHAIPACEVRDRFKKYEEILLILSSNNNVEGFNFCSIHRHEKSLLIGGRLVAIDPLHKGKGYLRTASLHIFGRYYWMFLKQFFRFKTTCLYIFSRQCNPIAYCLIHGGQTIYPDLVNNGPSEHTFPKHIVNQYKFLSRELNLDELDPNNGIVYQGACDAGIHSKLKNFRKEWATNWEDFVPEGSELISLIPVFPSFPLRNGIVLLKRFIKITLKKLSFSKIRGTAASVLIIVNALILSTIGFFLLAISCKNLARRLVKLWAKSALKLYGVTIEIEGKIPLKQGVIYAARHCSLLDTFIYPAILPHNTIIVAKQELNKFPILSQYFSAIGGIYVQKQSPPSVIQKLGNRISKLKSNDNIFVHPEGTRNPENSVGKLFSGVFFRRKKEEQIIPLSSFGGANLWPKGQFYSAPGNVKISIGKTITRSPSERKQAMALIKKSYLNHIDNFKQQLHTQ